MIYFAFSKTVYRIQTSNLNKLILHDIHVHFIIHILTEGNSFNFSGENM